jgi:hypothetical protein
MSMIVNYHRSVFFCDAGRRKFNLTPGSKLPPPDFLFSLVAQFQLLSRRTKGMAYCESGYTIRNTNATTTAKVSESDCSGGTLVRCSRVAGIDVDDRAGLTSSRGRR